SRGVEPEEIATAILNFELDAHRAQHLGVLDGVTWIDDSKATNGHAAAASLRALERVVWVVGGLLKGTDIGELVETHAERLRGAVVIGAEREAVLAAFAEHAPGVAVSEIVPEGSDFDVARAAVDAAAALADEGDTVLFAPAAASMDQFTDYADRGRRFQAALRALAEGR
ncbi:UDP-N-acetylmuramoyl-L-alanine--D-glutamate ligase, partial [Leucobacter sp. OLES1]